MKLWRVISPFFIMMGLVFYASIHTFGQAKTSPSFSKQERDSIFAYYNFSNVDSLPLADRITNVSFFLKGAYFYQQDSLIYKGLLQKTWLLGKVKQYDSAIKYTYKLYDLAIKNRDTINIEKALIKLGIYYKGNNQLTEAFKVYNEHFKLSRITKDSIRSGRSLLKMANIQTSLGDYSGSKTTAVDGVGYIEGTSDLRSLSGLYHIISVANLDQKNYKEAFKYNTRALGLAKDSLSIKAIGLNNILMFQNTKALILAGQGKYKPAITLLKALVSDSIVQKDNVEYARVLANLGYVKWQEEPKNKSSKEILIKASLIRKEIGDTEGLIINNIYLTKYYLEKNSIKALQYAEAAYENAKKRRNLVSILEALGFIFDLKENTRKEAKVFNQTYQKLQEVNQSNREIYAVTKYENEKLTNENLVLKAETAKKERQRIINLFVTIIIVLIGGFVMYLLRQRYKREKIREVYNAETRISKKLHDELANDVYHVMNQVQNNKNSGEVLDKLEDIYNRTRDISRENSGFDTEGFYAQELGSMLSSYGSNDTKIIIKDIDMINWPSVTPEKKIILHRILQELMINMKKHSNAALVAVTFKKTSKYIKINYADNGVGFSKKNNFYSNGLRNAENRIKTIGGIFIFDSEKGKGFKAEIKFPS